MLIGEDLAYSDVMNTLISTEQQLQRTINPSIYSPKDFKHKLAQGNNFLNRVMGQEKVATGLYNNASEVIREALRYMQTNEQLKLERLRSEVQKSAEQAEKGIFSERSIQDIIADMNNEAVHS